MLEEALKNYNFIQPEAIFIRHNENITYAVTDDNSKYLLRIHKAADGLDFSLHCGDTPRRLLIEGEIELLEKLYVLNGLKTQYPVKNKSGEYVTGLVSGDLVTVLSWLEGETLVDASITEELVYQIGFMIGQLHKTTIQLPVIRRIYYDSMFVDRTLAEIKQAYEAAHMKESHYKIIKDALLVVKRILDQEKKNFIIIHSDLSKSNLIYHNGDISPIDFSLSGYGVPEMDLGEMISSLNKDEFIPALLSGYEAAGHPPINKAYVSLFASFSIIQYIAIHHKKVYQDEKFMKSMDRWSNTIFAPLLAAVADTIR